MIRLYDVRNVARAMRGNVDAGPASQAVIEQFRATFSRESPRQGSARRHGGARINIRARGLLASDVEVVATGASQGELDNAN